MTIQKYDARSHMTVSTVLVFGPESVSYERSQRETAAKFNHVPERVFFVKISKSQDSMIYTIFSFFRIHITQIDSFPMLFSHPTRPPVRPGRPSWITGYQTGSCSSISQFTGHQNGSFSSISQFAGYANGSFSNIFIIPINSDDISI